MSNVEINLSYTDSNGNLDASTLTAVNALIGAGGGGSGLTGVYVASAHGLAGNGTTDDGPALQTLANTTLSSGGTIFLDPGKTFRIATVTTIPLGVTVWAPRTSGLLIDTIQMVISGTIDAGLWTVFTYTNGGTVVFSATNTQASSARVLGNTEIYPEWWGATATGGHDDTAAINACIAATTGLPLTPATTRRYAGPKVRLSAGFYRITDSIQATDVTGLVIEGAGRDNTTIKVDDNWSGTSHTATAATANTLTCSGTPFTAHQFNTGRWAVYIFSGTGAGQWAIVSDNTTNQVTTATNFPVTPDTTSVFYVMLVAGLDLDGVLAFTGSNFTVTATNAQMRHGIKYYRDSTLSAGGSTQGHFTNVKVNLGYLDSGWQLGSKDTTTQTNWQSDLCTLVGCQAIASGNTALTNLRGFACGDGSFDNVLNFTFLGCDAIGNAHGIFISATNVAWYGGTVQSNFLADICINNGVQGYATFNGFRSEGSRMLLDSISSQSFPFAISIRDVDFYTDQAKGNRFVSLCLGGTALTMENVRWVPDILTSGTASSGTATTLTDSTASFSTTTQTYFDQGTAVGHAGHQLFIRSGTGAGQQRTILSNTATAITVTAAFDVTPDATSTYEIMPSQQIYVSGLGSGSHLDLRHVLLGGVLPHNFIAQGIGVWTAELRDCGGLDRDANLIFGSAVRQPGVIYLSAGTTHPVTQSWGDPLSIGGVPDAYLSRSVAGYVTSPNFQTTNLVVAPIGTTGVGSAQKAGTHSGTTQYNYKLVARDGLGNPGLPSAIFSTPASCSATLSLDGAWILIIPLGGTLPPNCATIDVLKDNGSGTYGKIGTVAAYRFGEFVDYGQPIVTYTTPSADATGTVSIPDGSISERAVAPNVWPSAVNSGTTQTATWTQVNQKFLYTATGNCTYTIAGIPNGGSMLVVINSGAGSFTATFAAGAGLGSLRWDGGSAPVLTTTASKYDTFLFEYNGVYLAGRVVGQAA